jgi:DNA-binding XRE family transcriptional regulator
MQGRLKQLRATLGLDRQSMAALIGHRPEQVGAWEEGAEPLPPEDAERLSERLGVSPAWLRGEDVPVFGPRLLELRAWVQEQVRGLTGQRLVEMVSATTGERIAYVVRLMQEHNPKLLTLACAAAWLGLSTGSTELLLKGRLDPGSPVVARASELTGIAAHWFRVGPVDLMVRDPVMGDE